MGGAIWTTPFYGEALLSALQVMLQEVSERIKWWEAHFEPSGALAPELAEKFRADKARTLSLMFKTELTMKARILIMRNKGYWEFEVIWDKRAKRVCKAVPIFGASAQCSLGLSASHNPEIYEVKVMKLPAWAREDDSSLLGTTVYPGYLNYWTGEVEKYDAD